MRKIRKIAIVMLLAVAMLISMATPVMADPMWDVITEMDAMIQNYRRQLRELREELEELRNDGRVPLIHLVGPHNLMLEAGDDTEVAFTVRNIGSHAAHNFLSTATISADAPFIIEFVGNSNRINQLAQNSQRDMRMRIVVDEDAPPGATGMITFTHRYNTHLGAPQESQDTVLVRIGGEVYVPGLANLRLTNIRASDTNLGQNQQFNVTATLTNTGTAPANDIQIGITNMDTDSIILTSDLSDAAFSALEPGESEEISLTFRTARDITSGFYSIYFRIIYDRVAEGRQPVPFYVTAVADYATTSPNIELRNLNFPTAMLNVGQTGRITLDLVNTGDAVAHNILITATPLHEGRLVPTTSNRQTVQSLGVGSTRSFEFGFMPTVDAATHSHPVQIRVEYEIRGAGGEPHPFVQYVALNVYNPEPIEEEDNDDDDDEDTGRRQIPRIIVSAYTLYPQIPRAGQNFDMEITFRNTSRTQSVNNIRVVLEAPIASGQGVEAASGAVFTPVGGSNTIFIDYLSPGEELTRTVSMFTVPDAAPRMYALEVRLDYQDEEYEIHETVELLSIPVIQFSRLETQPSEIVVDPFMDMFGFVDFEFNIMNTGRVNLRNVRVRVDGNFDTHQANDYLGNLQMGRVVNFRGRIFPLEPGPQEGAIVVYAEDDAGEIVELIHPIFIDVMGSDNGFMGDDFRGGYGDEGWLEGGADERLIMGEMGDFDYMNGEEGGFFSRVWGFMRRPVFWGPAAGVVVAAVVAIVMIMHKKRSKLDFDDEN